MQSININFSKKSFKDFILPFIARNFKVKITNNPQFYFYDFSDSDFLNLNSNCIKIFFSMEDHFPNFNYCDYAIGTHRLSFDNRYFRIPFAYAHADLALLSTHRTVNGDMANRNFCNFIYSNQRRGAGTRIRNHFFTLLSKYKHIDSPGKAMNNMPSIDKLGITRQQSKLEFIKDYKFTIAFENNISSGYVTEKLSEPMMAQSLPIYYGANDAYLDFNKESFIDISTYASFEEAIDYIIYLDTHDDAYLDILNKSYINSDFNYKYFYLSFEKFLINIFNCPKSYTSLYSKKLDQPSSRLLQIKNNFENQFLLPLFHNNYTTSSSFMARSLSSEYIINDYTIDYDINFFSLLSSRLFQSIQLPYILQDRLKFLNKSSSLAEQQLQVILSASWRKGCSLQGQGDICWISTSETANLYRSLLSMLAPYDKSDSPKARIGPRADGGCVMPDPGTHGIVLSFGVSTKMGAKDRDYELAERGFRVFQFDSKFSASPRGHQNITFIPKKLSGSKNIARDEISFAAALEYAGLAAQQNALLFLDLEGGEWELFESMANRELSLFTHIHAEFHGLANKDDLPRRMTVFDKILRAHLPTHLHYHNCARILGFEDFLVSGTMEITFSRRNSGDFILSGESYPTALDAPNSSRLPDVHIGVFSLFQTGESSPASFANLPSVICDSNFMNAWFALAPGLPLNVPELLGKRADLANVLTANPSSAPQILLFWLWRCGIIEMPELTKLKPQLGHILKELHSIPYAEGALPGYTMLVHSLWLTRPDLKSLTPDLSYGQAAILMWFKDNAISEYGLDAITG